MKTFTSTSISNPTLRGRLAPSPTGALHLGNARTFLLAWLSIRSRGGVVILRMEDLDHPKVKPNAAQQALMDLRWLGLDWDEGPDVNGPHGPYVQTERITRYAEALSMLYHKGLVYPCTCSRSDVTAAQSAPHLGDDGPQYPATCRERFTTYEEAQAALPEDRLPAWRFRVPEGSVCFMDGFQGEYSECLYDTTGDFVLARHPDGAGYQLAVVVDDARMRVTEVVRGDDLIGSTPRQLLLYEALELKPPQFFHVPLVVGEDGKRLAKRHGDTRINWFREQGVSSEALVGWLASVSGLAPEGTRCTPHDLLDEFSFDRVLHTPIVVSHATIQNLLKNA